MINRKKIHSISRRKILQLASTGLLLSGCSYIFERKTEDNKLQIFDSPTAVKTTGKLTINTSDNKTEPLQRLMAGNQRFIAGKTIHPSQSIEDVKKAAKGQKPFAIILSCADSRVPPEIIFDQGVSNLFVLRVAGNILDDALLASIEYAVEHLHIPLLMVLGHKRCGAVEATLNVVQKGGEIPGHLKTLVTAIKPAVIQAKGKPEELLDQAVKANIKMVVQKLKNATPIVAKVVKVKKITIVGGYYDLDTGAVQIIS